MEMLIKIVDGRYTVNGKHLNELTLIEREFLNRFFIESKIK